MNWFSKKQTETKARVNWVILDKENQLDTIIDESENLPIAIFKHSTRCSISTMAKSRLERDWDMSSEEVKTYYLDLLTYRSVSNAIAIKFGVEHQSPQILLIKKGEVIYHASHSGISALELKNNL